MDLRPPPMPAVGPGKGSWLGPVTSVGTLLVGLAVLVVVLRGQPGSTRANADTARDVAAKLKAAGVLDEAAAQYGRYLAETQDPPATRAKVAYSLALLYMELGQYERSLRWLYETDALGAGDLRDEVGQKTIHCLERLGRVHAAAAALNENTALDRSGPARPTDDPVVATIGAKEIRASDVQRALDDLPPQLAKRFGDAKERANFLRKLVADELIARKAQKLELDKDPEVRRRVEAVVRQLIVDAFVEREIVGKVQVQDADLQNHFNANRVRFDQAEAVKLRLLAVATTEQANELRAQAGRGTDFAALARQHSLDPATKAAGGAVEGWVERGRPLVAEGDPAEVENVVFGLAKGGVSRPVTAGKHVYLFRVEDKRPAKQRTFDEVKPLVEQDYRMGKIQTSYQELVTQELSSTDVKLYPERLPGPR